jgi:tRNA-Thr(GGU) m(6)t(6)A37 methyltransferase TsaA
VPEARARLEFVPPFGQPAALAGLEGFSHLWIVFQFHGAPTNRWRPTVRPPRLGGRRRMGIFATRSIHRPNPIGISVVRLDEVCCLGGECWLELSGVDLLDGTPVLDIKPYLPWADAPPGASAAAAPAAPPARLEVRFTPEAQARCRDLEGASRPDLYKLICGILALDPRPGYRTRNDGRVPAARLYGIQLYDLDVRWRVASGAATVTEVELLQPPAAARGPSPP